MPQVTVNQAFEMAVKHHRAGRLREAEAIYQQILVKRPRSSDALHLLGLIAHQTGRHDRAVELIRRSLELNPDFADAHSNLGNVLRSTGNFDAAVDAYRQAVALNPGNATVLFNLGGALRETGQFEEAVAKCRGAVAIKPDFAEAHNALGNALRDLGRHEEAIAAYTQAVALKADYAEAHSNLGIALKNVGRLDDAIAAYRAAIAIKPDLAETHCNLGVALRDRARPEEAIAAFERAVALRSDFAEAHNNLGNAFYDRGEIEKAIGSYRRAIAIKPNVANVHLNLGIALKDRGETSEAMAACRRAIELAPDWAAPHLILGDLFREQGSFKEACAAFEKAASVDPDDVAAHASLAAGLAEMQQLDEAKSALARAALIGADSPLTQYAAGIISLRSGDGLGAVQSFRRLVEIMPQWAPYWNCLGEALRHVGRFDEAAECFEKILALRPGEVRAYNLMASLGARADAPELARLQAAFNDPQTPIVDRAALGFVLGKMFDDADRFDEAFGYYAEGNRLMLEGRHAAGTRYDGDAFSRRVDEMIERFNPAFFERTRGWGETSELPVFIVGMPRSGTSLVEQIAASHRDVVGAGERVDISNIESALGSRDWEPAMIRAAAHEQLNRLRGAGGSASRVIDKMPDNIERLGLIATLFPQARVILCRREPRDTCLSCFFQRFMAGNLFSFDLADCGRHHVQVDRLIAHWRHALPIRMLEVHYEELVADLERQSRRIIDFLGLPWDAACIEFHRTERTIQTASDWQVRQPIYKRSVGRWRNYERHLGALMGALMGALG